MTKQLTTNLKQVLATLLTVAALFAGQQAFATTKTVTYTLTNSYEGSYQYLGFTISGDTPFDGTSTIQQQLFSNRTYASFTLADGFSIYLSWGDASNVQFYNGNFYSSNYNIYYRVDYGSAFGGNNPYYITDIALTDMSGNTYMPLNGGGTAHSQPNNVQYLQQPYTAALNAYFGKLTITYADAPNLAIFTPHPNGGYCISNVNDLAHLADYVNKGHNDCNGLTFHQTTNITFSTTGLGDTDENYTTISGYFDGADRNFSGTYDGHGYTISGIRLYKNGTGAQSMNQGLFGRINTGATIQNVILTDARITGYRYVGGIVGNKVGGTVQNCLVLESTITCADKYVGALLGKNTGTLTANYYRNCTVNGTANATNVGVGGNGDVSSSGDQNGARSMHPLTIQNANVTVTGESVNYQNGTYYASNTTITLGYNNLPTGYQVTYSLNGTALSGNTFTMPAADNATVNASTSPITYNITYDLDGGSVSPANPATYNITTNTFTLNNPTKEGYTFTGWTGTDLTQPTQTVTITQGSIGNRSYTANWTPITYNITYDLDGGSVATTNPTSYNVTTSTFTLNNPTKEGYTFTGWTGTDLTQPTTTVTITQGSTGDRSYTANWIPTNYTITYNLDGGSVSPANPTSYNITTNTFTLNNPTRTGYIFAGWTGTDLTQPTQTVTITQGSTGNRNYTANWTDVWGIADGADGSEAHPYLITTTAGLDLLATEVNDGNSFSDIYFKLGNDITYDGTENNYTPIGNSNNFFKGTFDGNGYAVSGIHINTSGDYQGFFGRVGTKGTVTNITLRSSTITGKKYVGGIVGSLYGTVTDCRVESTVTIGAYDNNSETHGGIVGYLSNTVNGCISAATVTNNGKSNCKYYGGIVGYINMNTTLCNNIALGANVNANDYKGAIVGFRSDYCTFDHNYYHGCTVNGATTNVGTGNNGDVTTNDGAVQVFSLTLGENITATPAPAVTYDGTGYYFADTEITLEANAGYVFESITVTKDSTNPLQEVTVTENNGVYSFTMPAADVTVGATFTPDYATWWHADDDHDGTTEARSYIITTTTGLNLLAYEVNNGTIYEGVFFKLGADITYTHTTAWNDPTSTEDNYTAIGNNDNGFEGTFDGQGHTVSGIRIYKGGTTSADDFQGLFGSVLDGTIKNVNVTDVNITGRQSVGGIAGYIERNTDGGIIENCHVTGSVAIHAVVNNAREHGGIVGDNNGGSGSGSSSAATLTIADGIDNCTEYGGIVGSLNGTVDNCIVINANVSGTSNAGAILGGYNSNYSTLGQNFYYNCTVTKNGTANTTNVGCGDPSGDITENDGAVEAEAVTRTIPGYGKSTESDKWAFIASPMDYVQTPHHVQNLMATPATNYDLYRLNPSNTRWENYKAHANDFSIENGYGYLYANKETVTLTFLGKPSTDTEKTITLDEGWHLVGNPFDVNVTINRDYYTLNADGSVIVATEVDSSTPIAPCMGVIVSITAEEVASEDNIVTFTKVTDQQNPSSNQGSLQIALTQANTRGNALLDNAIVSFNEGSQLSKFYFGEQNANIYIPQGNEEYAIVSVFAGTDVPINFKAKENGEYTITVNPEGVEMNYLHLIDNMTGADVDLLSGGDCGSSPAMTSTEGDCGSSPAMMAEGRSYTFMAKTTDYESRFKLVFVANDASTGSASDATFAFYSNGSWIINNPSTGSGSATLQVIDINGRILSSETVNGRVSKAIHAAPGVYMLRLINGEDVKVQKIVVR